MEGLIETGPIQELPTGASQPAGPALDDNAVRAAIANAEAQGQNPERLTISDLPQGTPQTVQPTVQVPEKFLKPDGVVDVEKLKDSTRQLDQAIATKEQGLQEVQKSVEDYVKEYLEKQTRFRNSPNPEKIAAQLPPQPSTDNDTIPRMTNEQLQEMINRDISVNPAATVAQMIQLAIDHRFKPIEQAEKVNSVRETVKVLAEKDPRILEGGNFQAIKDKLDAEPDLWKLKNPYKAAWLEVKEDLRLGEPNKVQAQPSRPPSPILGGSPPPPPSVSGAVDPNNPWATLNRLDLRDKKQEVAGDQAIRDILRKQDRW